MGLLLSVRYVTSFRTVWVAIVFSLGLIYQAIVPQTHTFWGGWTVLATWLLIVALVTECIHREFSKMSWRNIDGVDLTLSVLVGLLVTVLAATVAIDFIPENFTSKVFTTHNVLSAFQCEEIIRISELHAQQNIHALLTEQNNSVSHPKVVAAFASAGWLTTRHANYPTTDISAYTIKQNMSLTPRTHNMESDVTDSIDFVQWLNHTVETTILPILQMQFDLVQNSAEPPLLSMQDLFVVKYDADNPYAQKHLEIHTDSSQLSFNIALSTHVEELTNLRNVDGTSYTGGGTYFVRTQSNIYAPKGAMLSHPSRLYHAGSTLTRGKRYILVGFVKVQTDAWTTIYRRFGMFSQCVTINSAVRSQGADLYAIKEEQPMQCQSYPYVFFYELNAIVTDPFTKARTNPKSFWLAGLFSVIILCVFLSFVSVIMLLLSPPDQDDKIGDNSKSEDITGLVNEPEIFVVEDETRDVDFSKKLK